MSKFGDWLLGFVTFVSFGNDLRLIALPNGCYNLKENVHLVGLCQNNWLTEVPQDFWENITAMRFLRTNHINLTANSFTRYTKLQQLIIQNLRELQDYEILYTDPSTFLPLTELKSLSITNTSYGSNSNFMFPPNIERLYLVRGHFAKVNVSYVSKLEILSLGYNEIREPPIFPESAALTGLYIAGNDVGGILDLSRFKSLQYLFIELNSMVDVPKLHQLAPMREFGAADNLMYDVTVESLAQYCVLEVFGFSYYLPVQLPPDSPQEYCRCFGIKEWLSGPRYPVSEYLLINCTTPLDPLPECHLNFDEAKIIYENCLIKHGKLNRRMLPWWVLVIFTILFGILFLLAIIIAVRYYFNQSGSHTDVEYDSEYEDEHEEEDEH